MSGHRRRDEHTADTRAALLNAAREVFSEFGFHAAATEEIVRRARVTRGALYHHFATKKAVFEATFDEVSRTTMQNLRHETDDNEERWKAFTQGCIGLLDVASEPVFRRIVLLDGPVVLGRSTWQSRMGELGLNRQEENLAAAMAEGSLPSRPMEQLGRLVLAAIIEAALIVAECDDPDEVRPEVANDLLALFDGLRAPVNLR